jgi:hypothetical protein
MSKGIERFSERELLSLYALGTLSRCEMVFGWARRDDSAVPEIWYLYVSWHQDPYQTKTHSTIRV